MYLAIIQDPFSLIRAVEIDASAEKDALSKCVNIEEGNKSLQVHFLINKKDGDIKRVYKNESGYQINESAFEYLGVETDHTYFDTEKAE
jgi:ABC-type uncharacterized transport system substrate-binding protein